jgi:hypothetical protein
MNDQRNISLSEIGQISVNVHDFDRAVAFLQRHGRHKTPFYRGRPDGVLRLSWHPLNVGDPGAPGLGSSELDSLLQGGRPLPVSWSQRQFNSMSPIGSWPTALPILGRGSKSVWRTRLPQH